MPKSKTSNYLPHMYSHPILNKPRGSSVTQDSHINVRNFYISQKENLLPANCKLGKYGQVREVLFFIEL